MRLTHSTRYTTEKSIVIDAAKIKCLDQMYAPCTIELELTGGNDTFFELRNGAALHGSQVLISAPYSQVRILEDSSLSVSGHSLALAGTHTKGGNGASFIA